MKGYKSFEIKIGVNGSSTHKINYMGKLPGAIARARKIAQEIGNNSKIKIEICIDKYHNGEWYKTFEETV